MRKIGQMGKGQAARETPVPRGFTLVELLVVVSIIALLIAILLPSLRKAREQAKAAACLANLTGIGKASLTYAAEDRNENMIPVPVTDVLEYASGSLEWGGKAGRGQAVNKDDPTTSLFGTGAYRGPAHRPLNRTIYKATSFTDYNPVTGDPNPGPGNINWLNDTKLDLPIYRCPSDIGYAGGGFIYTGGRHERDELPFQEEGLTAYDHYGTSYSANCFWIIGGIEGNRVRSQSVYMCPLSRIPTPSASIAYQEWPSRFTWLWGSWKDPPSGCEWTNREQYVGGHFNSVPGWHRRPFTFAVAFADGHAEMAEMKGCQRPSPNLGLGNYPADVCPEGVDAYECDRCVTVRGPGWRLDTLPAPAVLTPYYYQGSP